MAIFGTPFFIFIDSPWFDKYCAHGQDICNLIMIINYSWFLYIAKGKLYWIILLMTICSFFAECLGSLILVLYQYRLKNIPVYIPLGHAMIYATVYLICKQPLVWTNHKIIEPYLTKFAFLTAFLSLLLLNDVAGFILYILFLITIRHRQKPIFYLSMFFMTYYVELTGTVLSSWEWYGVLGNHPNYPTIGFTPSCAAGLYILIDLASNSAYLYAKKIKRYIRPLVMNQWFQSIHKKQAFQ